MHLFFTCEFSQRVWNYLQIDWSGSQDMFQAIIMAKRYFAKPFFMEVVATVCWHIWLQRNARVFQMERPSFARWKTLFVHDLSLLSYRIKCKYKGALLAWIEGLA